MQQWLRGAADVGDRLQHVDWSGCIDHVEHAGITPAHRAEVGA
ncbi:hypothetical protein Ga0466249_005466 [Sporomusaceae bacterium BoRhaA]|nr:hypothetical protein [Pelorhabdus rhamnosifermentans]